MTKKKFLNELEKKLSVLDDSEIQDIMNEYSDIIDEKLKQNDQILWIGKMNNIKNS